MLRSLAIAGLCFAIMFVAAGSMMLHPTPHALLDAIIPSARDLAVTISAMSFAVAAVIEQGR